MPADISAITYFAPIAAFLIVFAVVFAVLIKTKILGEHKLGVLSRGTGCNWWTNERGSDPHFFWFSLGQDT